MKHFSTVSVCLLSLLFCQLGLASEKAASNCTLALTAVDAELESSGFKITELKIQGESRFKVSDLAAFDPLRLQILFHSSSLSNGRASVLARSTAGTSDFTVVPLQEHQTLSNYGSPKFSHDGSTLLSTSGSLYNLKVWDTKAGQVRSVLESEDSVHHFGLSPDGKVGFYSNVGRDGEPDVFTLFKTSTGKTIAKFSDILIWGNPLFLPNTDQVVIAALSVDIKAIEKSIPLVKTVTHLQFVNLKNGTIERTIDLPLTMDITPLLEQQKATAPVQQTTDLGNLGKIVFEVDPKKIDAKYILQRVSGSLGFFEKSLVYLPQTNQISVLNQISMGWKVDLQSGVASGFHVADLSAPDDKGAVHFETEIVDQLIENLALNNAVYRYASIDELVRDFGISPDALGHDLVSPKLRQRIPDAVLDLIIRRSEENFFSYNKPRDLRLFPEGRGGYAIIDGRLIYWVLK
jgi:hypothetical protein